MYIHTRLCEVGVDSHSQLTISRKGEGLSFTPYFVIGINDTIMQSFQIYISGDAKRSWPCWAAEAPHPNIEERKKKKKISNKMDHLDHLTTKPYRTLLLSPEKCVEKLVKYI